jgi:hypothetical protein
MPELPVLFDDQRFSRSLAKATRHRERGEMAVYRAEIDARVRAAVDEADSRAVADVTETALIEEMRVMDRGLERAGDSPAKRALVARHVAQQSDIDLRRIARRFGE